MEQGRYISAWHVELLCMFTSAVRTRIFPGMNIGISHSRCMCVKAGTVESAGLCDNINFILSPHHPLSSLGPSHAFVYIYFIKTQ